MYKLHIILVQESETKELNVLYEKKTSIIKKEYELRIASRKQELEYLRNLLAQILVSSGPQKQIDQRPVNSDSSMGNKHIILVVTMACKGCNVECADNPQLKCISCTQPLCNNCSKRCPNKNFSHPVNNYCQDCMAQCSVCLQTRQCKSCVKKCFSSNCNNIFCNQCFERNKHQVRAEGTNCKFYKCDGCQIETNCIMSTVFCGKCNKRVCNRCFQTQHSMHV